MDKINQLLGKMGNKQVRYVILSTLSNELFDNYR